MGHNFGSPHDETSNCLNQPDGNYLMYSQASDGSKTNNRLFSPCSIISMTAVIEAKGANADGCFTAQTGGTFCGNGIVEGINYSEYNSINRTVYCIVKMESNVTVDSRDNALTYVATQLPVH